MPDLPSPRPTSRLAITGLLVLVASVLGWLLMGFAGEHGGWVALPDAAGSRVEFFHDETGRLTLAEVGSLPASDWQRWPGTEFLRAGRGTALWLRVTLHNPGPRPVQGVLAGGYYFVDEAEAWLEEPGAAGLRHENPLDGRDLAFAITVPARGTQVVWVRTADFFKVFLLPAWWPEAAAFHAWQTRGLLAEGVYFGGLLALLAYNTMLWLRLRLKGIGYYVLYLGAAAITMLLTRAYLPALGWTLDSPALETALAVTLALSGFFLTQFAREFLELRERLPRAEGLVRGLRGLLLVLAAGGLATPWMERPYALAAAVLGIGVTHVTLLVVALWAWRAGIWQARFFLMSFGCLFAGSLSSVAIWVGRTALLNTAMLGVMIGSAAEMLLLSLAVADRFAQAQRKLIAETEQRRLMEETYAEELELEVRERTRELETANADKDRMLAIVGHDLRGPLTGLMRVADADKGEVGREVTRTVGTVLLLIEDLVLWGRLRAGALNVAAHPAESLVAAAVALHRTQTEHAGVELTVDVPGDVAVQTDLVLAQTLVRNLLANALKFAETRVVLRAENNNGQAVRFTLSNDGPPLSPDVAARFAVGENQPITATGGLGLRLCREICAVLGTKLEAGDAPEGGTEFSFTLPVAATAGSNDIS